MQLGTGFTWRLAPVLAGCKPANDVVGASGVDAMIDRAIQLMHERPEEPWTVAALARASGCSRATFARRFAAATGTSPLAFLTLVRLHRAAGHLAHSDAGLAAIAAIAGYATEFAFGRAFKRALGVSPGRFRRALWRRPSSAPPAIGSHERTRAAA